MRPSVSVFGAAGFTGALTARLLYAHPEFELRALTARSDVGRRLDDLYPYHRVPNGTATSTLPWSLIPTGRRRRWWPHCASGGCVS